MSETYQVGMVSCYFPPSIGGVQTHITEVSTILSDRGYEVTGFTTETKPSDLDDILDIVRVSSPITTRRTIPIPRPQESIKVARLARRLSQDCDIVHIHSAKRLFALAGALAARLSSTPVVLSLHGGGIVDQPELAVHRRLTHTGNRRLLLYLADVIISTCPHFTDVATRYVSESKIREIPNGIDTDVFTPNDADREDLNGLSELNPDANVLLSVNMIKRVKGLQYVVQALPEVLEEYPATHYVIVGDGAWRERLEDIAVDLGVSEHLHFPGAVYDKTVVREYFRAADVALTPSSGESTSISTLEAMATECPVVATPVGGLADLLGKNERGRVAPLFPPGSYTRNGPVRLPREKVSLLAEEILWVLSNPREADAMAAAGRRYVLENYAWPVIVDQLEEVYAELTATQ